MSAATLSADARGPTVLIATGGTGGHVYPALAVAERLRALGARVVWLGTAAGLEARVVPARGIELHTLRVAGVRGKGVARWLKAPFVVLGAVLEALRLVRRARARLVLGMGGYASLPGALAGRLLGLPLLIHEQNAVPGMANRVLARLATRVLEAFPGSFAPAVGARVVGNPLRPEIAALPPPAARPVERTVDHVLVLGGSQGALALNRTVPAALGRIGGRRLEIRHQCGERHLETTRAAYRDAGLDVSPIAFVEDMAAAYGWADVVVCRAGAMTVSELAAAGVASVLVPFPHAVDDHQTRNARFLADAGAAVLMPESALAPEALATTLSELLDDRDRLSAMARAARALARPDATEHVARQCLEVADG